ncbi:MAG TPA: PilZ domain-containing protein [Candidatus Omnitrophota bacterium]|nr:PilZ domain-containing protein [Candidatus Omnitrophota bacterium]
MKAKSKKFTGAERRRFIRLSYRKPLMYKLCKRTTICKILEGYTRDISNSGLRCNLNEKVAKDTVLWLKLDAGAIELCKEIEKNSVVIQQGILGKVVWQKKLSASNYDTGVRFITREEKPIPGIVFK